MRGLFVGRNDPFDRLLAVFSPLEGEEVRLS